MDIADVNAAATNTLSLEKHKNADENAAFSGAQPEVVVNGEK